MFSKDRNAISVLSYKKNKTVGNNPNKWINHCNKIYKIINTNS